MTFLWQACQKRNVITQNIAHQTISTTQQRFYYSHILKSSLFKDCSYMDWHLCYAFCYTCALVHGWLDDLRKPEYFSQLSSGTPGLLWLVYTKLIPWHSYIKPDYSSSMTTLIPVFIPGWIVWGHDVFVCMHPCYGVSIVSSLTLNYLV